MKYKNNAAKLSLLMVLPVAHSAIANENYQPASDWEVELGIGAMYEPISPGIDKSEFGVVPYVDITYKERFFLNGERGIGAYLYQGEMPSGDFALGLSFDYDDGRDSSDFDNNSPYKRLGDIKGSVVGKMFAEAEFGIWSADIEFAQALSSSGHKGWYVEAGVGIEGEVAKDLYMGIGPSVRFSSKKLLEAYYGVNQKQANDTGFKTYNPGTGLENVGFGTWGRYSITNDWSVLWEVEYQRLMGDAKDSPVSNKTGQVMTGLAVSYTF